MSHRVLGEKTRFLFATHLSLELRDESTEVAQRDSLAAGRWYCPVPTPTMPGASNTGHSCAPAPCPWVSSFSGASNRLCHKLTAGHRNTRPTRVLSVSKS